LSGIDSVYYYEVDIISGTGAHGKNIVRTLSSTFSNGLSYEDSATRSRNVVPFRTFHSKSQNMPKSI